MENTKITKAEEKKIRQATETLTFNLKRELTDFKERFLASYVNYRFAEIEAEIRHIKSLVFDVERNGRFGYTLESFNKNNEYKIAQLEKQKALKFTNTLKFINEANENFNIKFNRLVSELVKHGVRSYPLTIESISNGSTANDFNFLITHNSVQVYARIIFAEGLINAPHYRFIITANKNLIH
jgi:hypothetical protein